VGRRLPTSRCGSAKKSAALSLWGPGFGVYLASRPVARSLRAHRRHLSTVNSAPPFSGRCHQAHRILAKARERQNLAFIGHIGNMAASPHLFLPVRNAHGVRSAIGGSGPAAKACNVQWVTFSSAAADEKMH